ncbi:acyloxyacyl hydrolase [Ramlibacter lithotrophicus]|nr:acyloxyacyl hydrolase [Ramlibacter lithotrophicus]
MFLTMHTRRITMLLAAALLATGARADLRPQGMFVQAGAGEDSARALSVGAVWPWSWQRQVRGGRLEGITEAYVSRWSVKDGGRRAGFTHVGVVPLLRYRFEKGRSPWFVEAGIGLTYMDRTYRTSEKQFSTHFNFADVLGAGRNFGEGQRQEVSLRLTHFSNGGLKHPNPGMNLVRLRYGVMF